MQNSTTLENINPNQPHWNWWTAFIVWLASVGFIIFIPGIALAFYALFTKQTDSQSLTISPQAILVNLIAVLPAHLLTLALAWLIVSKGGKISFPDAMGWQMGGINFYHITAIVIGIFAFAAILSNLVPEQENDLLRILRSSRAAVFVVAIMATFTAPIVEEVVYRGVMYSAALKEFGQTQAIICSTAYFALVHVPQYYPSYSTIFMICLLSLILTLVRVKSKNLLPCIILHTIFNGIQSLFLVLEPYLKSAEDEQKAQPAQILLSFFS